MGDSWPVYGAYALVVSKWFHRAVLVSCKAIARWLLGIF